MRPHRSWPIGTTGNHVLGNSFLWYDRSMKQCEFKSCERDARAHGLCNPHCLQLAKVGGDKGRLKPVKKYYSQTWCDFEGCTRSHASLGLCNSHYAQYTRRGRDMTKLRPIARPGSTTGICSEPNCGRFVECLGLCNSHRRMKAAGLPMRPISNYTKHNPGEICGAPGCAKLAINKHLCANHYKLSSMHKMSLEQIVDLYTDPSCDICGDNGETSRLHIDHDHSCCPPKTSCDKCRRGLLCSGCNTSIGLLKEDIPRIKAIIRYLERGRKK